MKELDTKPKMFPQPYRRPVTGSREWIDQKEKAFLPWKMATTFVSPDPHFASHRDDILLFRNSLEESMQAFYAKEVYHNTLFIDLTEARMPAHDHSPFPLKPFQESARKIEAFSVIEFTKGFGKGLPKGMYDSGKGLASCAVDLLIHPGDTLGQMADAIELFSNLIRSKEWEALGQALSPEAHQLITRWDELNSYTKGNLTGYVIGKFGADILVPGAAMKVVSRGARGAREMVFMARNLRSAESSIVLRDTVSFAERKGISLAGSKRVPFDYAPFQPIRNKDTIINGRIYVGHALDRMQARGLMPSVVESTINKGQNFPTRPGTVGYYDYNNNVRVIINSNNGKVITVIPGAPR